MKTKITINIDKELLEELELWCVLNGKTISETIEDFIIYLTEEDEE